MILASRLQGFYHTRISADGESVLGGGGVERAVPFGFVIRGRIRMAQPTPHPRQGDNLGRGGQTCFTFLVGIILAALVKLSTIGGIGLQGRINQKQFGSIDFVNKSTTGAYYHVLNHPGGVGAGGRIRLEFNDTHFEGVTTAVAGYSAESTLAAAYLSGERGSIVSLPGILQDKFSSSENWGKEHEDPSNLMEDGIDIKIYNHQLTTPANRESAQIAGIFLMQKLLLSPVGAACAMPLQVVTPTPM